MTGVIELLNQEKIRKIQEKETYQYLEMLETGPIKQVEMKRKKKKHISGERKKNSSKPNIKAETSSKR